MDDIEKARFVDALDSATKLLDFARRSCSAPGRSPRGALRAGRPDLQASLRAEGKGGLAALFGARQDPCRRRERPYRSDRRVRVDRRIVGMQKLLLSVA